mmetsp:Transcript_1573/g.4014  ORF Transcript_1573/g.4014 Transcript_1573/m.4014 type:complete len:247 (+) Transcript_1573:310-1050(+)
MHPRRITGPRMAPPSRVATAAPSKMEMGTTTPQQHRASASTARGRPTRRIPSRSNHPPAALPSWRSASRSSSYSSRWRSSSPCSRAIARGGGTSATGPTIWRRTSAGRRRRVIARSTSARGIRTTSASSLRRTGSICAACTPAATGGARVPTLRPRNMARITMVPRSPSLWRRETLRRGTTCCTAASGEARRPGATTAGAARRTIFLTPPRRTTPTLPTTAITQMDSPTAWATRSTTTTTVTPRPG